MVTNFLTVSSPALLAAMMSRSLTYRHNPTFWPLVYLCFGGAALSWMPNYHASLISAVVFDNALLFILLCGVFTVSLTTGWKARLVLSHWSVKTFLPSVLRHCWSNRKGIQPVKSWVLVCWWWRFDWRFARLIAPVVTNTSIILSFNKIQK